MIGPLTFRHGGGDGLKIAETIEFLTQIHKSWDGTEQRAALRTRPRRMVSYDYIGMESWQSQYIRALAYSQQTQLLQIPLWHAATRTKQKYYSGGVSFSVPAESVWQYRGCSNAQLWLSDGYGGTLFPINVVASDGTVHLKKQFDNDWHAGATIACPVAWGIFSQEDKYTNTTSQFASVTMNIELMREQQAPTFPPAMDEYHYEPAKQLWGHGLPAVYNGAELFLTPPSWTDEMQANFKRNAFRLDNSTGTFRYDLRSADPQETREIEYVMKEKREINNLQRFFYRCKGRYKSFFAPTWLQDVELVADAEAGDNFLLAKWSLYWKYFSVGQRRKTLVVFDKDFSAQIITVAGYATNETGEFGKIYLDSPLRKPIRINNTLMISYLCRYRLDNDSMITDYQTTDVALTSLTMMEVTE